MILIITHKLDFTADFVINKLNQNKIAYKRLNCEDIFNSEFNLKFDTGFSYSLLGESNYKSVWFRRTMLPDLKNLGDGDKKYILDELESFFENLFSSLSANWLSSPFYVYRAENKILQLKIAKEIGFKIPPTLVTNSKRELVQFFDKCNGEMILKPISQTRIQYHNTSAFIFTSPVSESYIKNIGDYDLTPCIFQKNITKDYEIRVTVVENKVFAAAVYSQQESETKNDWRKKKLDFHQIELPSDIEKMCVEMVKKLNLKFGAIDIIKTPDDEYYFLEINPNGQWAWIEMQTKQDISGAIIEFLTR